VGVRIKQKKLRMSGGFVAYIKKIPATENPERDLLFTLGGIIPEMKKISVTRL